MCLTCGCGDAHDNHGNKDYLTIDHVRRSAAVDGISVREAGKRARMALRVDRKAHPAEHERPVAEGGAGALTVVAPVATEKVPTS